LIQALSPAGLVSYVRGDIYELHPLLSGYLHSNVLPKIPAREQEPFITAFVEVTGSMADTLPPLGYTQKQMAYYFLADNIRGALLHAKSRNAVLKIGALLQSLAALAQNARDFDSATQLYEELAAHAKAIRFTQAEAAAYFQLGRISTTVGDFITAEQRDRSALSLYEQAGDLGNVAHTCNSIGICNIQMERFQTAEESYEKALKVLQSFPNDSLTAMAYHGLGTVALKRRELDKGEGYYIRALRLERDQDAIGAMYHQLARVAQERGDHSKAELWFLKSLQFGDRPEVDLANTYHQLAVIASQRNDLVAARRWCGSCLGIAEKWNDERLTADSYNLMGVITLQEQDYAASEQWFKKALPIAEQKKLPRTLVICYRHHGILAALNGRFVESGGWFIKARLTAGDLGDPELIGITSDDFAATYEHAATEQQSELAKLWAQAGLGTLPTTSTQAPEQNSGKVPSSSLLSS
jgi:tetratricopeptide (TPR) repeat protein